MKERMSFVANSSSSSFIIGIKNLKIPAWCEKFFAPIFSRNTTFNTLEEYDQYVCEDYGYDTIEEFLEDNGSYCRGRYEDVKTALEAGYTVMNIRVDNNDETLQYMLSALPEGLTDEVCLIRNEC